jgi:hypothetical protein
MQDPIPSPIGPVAEYEEYRVSLCTFFNPEGRGGVD